MRILQTSWRKAVLTSSCLLPSRQGERVGGVAEQSIVAMMEACKPADLVSALATYALDEPRFMGVLLNVRQIIDDVIAASRQHEKENDNKK